VAHHRAQPAGPATLAPRPPRAPHPPPPPGPRRTRTLGRELIVLSQCESTQTLLSKCQKGLPSGIVAVTDVQRGGRGRRGNAWESPEGCLMFSGYLLSTLDGLKLALVQHVVCLAVTRALDEVSARAGAGDAGFRIKWPNDVYCGRLKIGGVLCESSLRASGEFSLVFGLGLNVNNSAPTTCVRDAVAQAAADSELKVSREEVMALVLSHMEDLLGVLEAEGFGGTLRDLYLERWIHSGQQVELDLGQGDGTVPAVISGIDAQGYLTAEVDGEGTVTLNPDMTRLDPLEGTLRVMPPGH